MMYIKAVLAGAILWTYDLFRGTARHDPVWRKHHDLPKEWR